MKLFLLISLCFCLFSSYSKDNKSKLLLKVWDDSEFIVEFDKVKYKTPVSKFRLNRVEPGNHRLIVIKEIVGPSGYREKELLYKGTITIPPNSRILAKINRFNELMIVSVHSLDKEQEMDLDRERRDNVLSAISLKKIINDMEAEKYESDKLKIAENQIGNQKIKTNQVMDIIKLLGFESAKLDFAKYIYPSVVNKKSFSKVNDVFIKNSSIEELSKFIRNYHIKNGDIVEDTNLDVVDDNVDDNVGEDDFEDDFEEDSTLDDDVEPVINYNDDESNGEENKDGDED